MVDAIALVHLNLRSFLRKLHTTHLSLAVLYSHFLLVPLYIICLGFRHVNICIIIILLFYLSFWLNICYFLLVNICNLYLFLLPAKARGFKMVVDAIITKMQINLPFLKFLSLSFPIFTEFWSKFDSEAPFSERVKREAIKLLPIISSRLEPPENHVNQQSSSSSSSRTQSSSSSSSSSPLSSHDLAVDESEWSNITHEQDMLSGFFYPGCPLRYNVHFIILFFFI